MPLFQGVVPPLVTPLTERFEVDYASLSRVIDHLLDAGVHGVFVLGSTSEVVFHGEIERVRIIEHAMRHVAGRVPVFAGAIDPASERVIAHARAAEAAGVDAVVVTAPFYARTSQPEIVDHFCYVREALDVPVIAYDIPVCVGTKLARDTIVTLAREGAIAGLKDSSGDDATFRYVLADMAMDADFFAMTGSETLVDNALHMGAHGVVPGLGNVDPRGYVRLWEFCQGGDMAAARAEQERLCRLFEMIKMSLPRTSPSSAGVGAFKTAMRSLGIIDTNVMARPQRALNGEEAARIDAILRATGLLE